MFETIIQLFQTYKRQKRKLELILQDLRETHERRFAKYQDNLKEQSLKNSVEQYDKICVDYNLCQDQLAQAFYVLLKIS